MIEDLENGNATSVDAAGNEIPLKDDKDYQALKKRTPADYRDIKPIRKARPLPKEVADELEAVWRKMLLDAKYPKDPVVVEDGVAYEFSGPLTPGEGAEMSAHIDSPEQDSRTGRFVALAEGLAEYADGKADLERLKALLKKADQP